ncbi:hypothetical protein MASR1M59_29050 [Melaminivora sp.]
MTPTPSHDERVNAWFESQSEELLRDLGERYDAYSPRACWEAFFSPPAAPSAAESSPAPSAEQPGGEPTTPTRDNSPAWLSIASFLSLQYLRLTLSRASSGGSKA